jgi:transposase-like protein
MQRRLTPEEQQEACDLVKAGVSLRQTAKQFGISRNALERILQGGESGEK